MKRAFPQFLLAVFFTTGISVMMEPKIEPEINADENAGSFQNVLATCLATKNHNTFECVNRGALSVLQSIDSEDIINYDSVKLERAEGEPRDLLDLDYDPRDFGNVVQAASRLMERRNMKWDLSNLYPGLQMRVGPMLNGNGVLEFVMDERFNGLNERQLGTGRVLMRSLVLPFLLGFKFSLSSLIPLVFGIILLITKKALFLTKIALLLSGLLGWNSIINNGQGFSSGYPGSPFGHSFGHGFGGSGVHGAHGHDVFGGGFGGFSNHEHHYPYRPTYRSIQKSPDFPSHGQHVVREVINVYGSQKHVADKDSSRDGKNFVWTT